MVFAPTRNIIRVVLLLQDREPIEPDGLVRNARRAEEVANRLRDEKNNLVYEEFPCHHDAPPPEIMPLTIVGKM